MWEYARKLEVLDAVATKSKLTEKEALEIGKAIKQSLSERYSRAQGRND